MFFTLFRVLFSCIILLLLLLLFFYYQHQLDHSHRQAQLATIHSNTTTGNHILTHCKTHHKPTKPNHRPPQTNKSPPRERGIGPIASHVGRERDRPQIGKAQHHHEAYCEAHAPPRNLLRERSEAHVTTANPTERHIKRDREIDRRHELRR